MTNEQMGAFIGAIFGLVYVLVNAGELPDGIGLTLRVAGIVAFIGLAGMLFLRRNAGTAPSEAAQQPGFSRGYWLVVAAEVIALVAGLFVINGLLDAPDAGVAWVSLVVGLHFVGLAVVWRNPFVRVLGIAIAICGAVGLALASADVSGAVIAAIAGVIPGVLLLGTGWWYALGKGMPSSREQSPI